MGVIKGNLKGLVRTGYKSQCNRGTTCEWWESHSSRHSSRRPRLGETTVSDNVYRPLSDSKAQFLSGSLCCSWYRCSWWSLEINLVASFSLPTWLPPQPGLRLGPRPLLHTITPGDAVLRKDLPGVGIDFSESQVKLANILEVKEWPACGSDTLPQFPVEDLPCLLLLIGSGVMLI